MVGPLNSLPGFGTIAAEGIREKAVKMECLIPLMT